jgi:hypothetical protein
MATQLSASLNKIILVAIPALFGDLAARRCRLVAAEPSGLWLVSEDLARAVQPEAKQGKTEVVAAIFVPFAQIAAVLPVATAQVDEAVGLKPATATPATLGAKTKESKPPPKTRSPRNKPSGPAGA